MGRRKKYNTEEERKAAKRERNRRYREEHKDKITAYNAAYKAAHKKEIAAYNAAHKDEIAAKNAAYYQKNKEEILAKRVEYYADHKEEIAAYRAAHYATPFGRATCLVCAYRKADSKHNRGECTVTPEWMVDNIFTQPCHYCGESDWKLLGCDRLDNSLPHTPENCVPCCKTCNEKKQKTEYDEFMRMIGKIA